MHINNEIIYIFHSDTQRIRRQTLSHSSQWTHKHSLNLALTQQIQVYSILMNFNQTKTDEIIAISNFNE